MEDELAARHRAAPEGDGRVHFEDTLQYVLTRYWLLGTHDVVRIAAHPPLRVVPQLLYAERKRMEEAMGMLIIRHKVKDYGKWRPMFDQHSLMQKAAGLSNPRVFRSANDKSEIVVVFDTQDTKRAKDFAASPDLRGTMAKAGVMDDPTIYFLESV